MTQDEEIIRKNVSHIEKLLPISSRCLRIFDIKAVYLYSILVSILWLLGIIGLLVKCLQDRNQNSWWKHGQMIVGSFGFEIQLGVCLLSYPKWKDMRNVFALKLVWDLNELSPTTRNMVRRKCKHTEIGFIAICLLGMVSTLVIQLEATPHLSEYVHSIPLVEKYVTPFYEEAFVWCIIISMYYLSLTMVVGVYYSQDLTDLTRIQYIILYSIVRDFAENSNGENSNNNYVKNKLKFIIKRHQDILRASYYERWKAYIPHLFITISLLCFGICLNLMVYSPYYGNKLPLISVATTLVMALYFAHQGQIFLDLNENLGNLLYELKWYEWDVGNRKLFQIIYLYSSAATEQHVPAVAKITHSYFTQTLKLTYTVINIARTISHR